jgi:hypothetical protein
MSTPEILIITNLILIFLCLSLVYPKAIAYIREKKIIKQRKAKQVESLKKANFVKTIRTEVRKYLKEIQSK